MKSYSKEQKAKSESAIRYCIYARKSMEAEERQALSIDSQIKEMQAIADRDGLKVVALKTESHSAKNSGQRPVFNEIIKDLQTDKYNALLTWAPDRLSRNAGDLGMLVDLMDHGNLVQIRTFNQQFSNSPNEKFLLMILGSQAKLENDNKAVNVQRGLRARAAMGLWPTGTPTGYCSPHRTDRPCEKDIDEERAPIVKKIFERVAYEGLAIRDIERWLKQIDFRSSHGKHLNFATIHLMLHRPFYYGRFEYPIGSGNWFKGKHKPIITKKLFDLVQEVIAKRSTQRRGEKAMVVAPFTFLHLMRCGFCGSGITAQEKYKKLRNGDLTAYRYYMCTKARDRFCPGNYLNEKDLIVQLGNLIDKVDLDLIGLRDEFEAGLHRLYRYESYTTGEPFRARPRERREIDLRAYAKEMFTSGTSEEQRAILYRLKSRIIVKDKKVYLDESAEQASAPPPEELRSLLLELKTTDRALAHHLMQTNEVHPGQTLDLPGGAHLVFREQIVPKTKGSKMVRFSFLVENLDDTAGRKFSAWLRDNLERTKKSLKRIAINEKKMTVDTIEKVVQGQLKTNVKRQFWATFQR